MKINFFYKGFWYRLISPSSSAQLGKFYNNSVHSVGSYGLWIFPSYTPSSSPAVFDTFISYSNDKGAEWTSSNKVQFNNFIVYDHTTAGIETKTIQYNSDVQSNYSAYFYNESSGPTIMNSVIIGNSNSSSNSSITPLGLVIAWDRGELIKNVTFINFPDANSVAIGATSIAGVCTYIIFSIIK